jgi:hypothetical protein
LVGPAFGAGLRLAVFIFRLLLLLLESTCPHSLLVLLLLHAPT